MTSMSVSSVGTLLPSCPCGWLLRPGQQQVAIPDQAEDVQVKGPQSGAQAADMLGQVTSAMPLHHVLLRSAQQMVDRHAFSGALE